MPQTFERRGTTVPLSVSSFNHTRVRELIDGDERLLEAVIPNYSGVRRGEFTVLAWDDLKTLATFSERDTYIMEKVSKSRSHKDIDPIKLRMICQQADAIYQPDAHIRRLAREQAQRDREDRDMVRLSCLAQLTRECGIARGDAFMAKASSKTLMDLMTGDPSQSRLDVEMLIERVMQFAAERSNTTVETVRDWMEPLVGMVAPFGAIGGRRNEDGAGFLFRQHVRLIEFRRSLHEYRAQARHEIQAPVDMVIDVCDTTITYVNERLVKLDDLLGSFADMFEVFENSVARLEKLRRDVAFALDGWDELVDRWDDAIEGRNLIGGELAIERALEHVLWFLPVIPARELYSEAGEAAANTMGGSGMERTRLRLVQQMYSWFNNQLDAELKHRVDVGRKRAAAGEDC